jgi:hypothetical protein
MKLTLHGLLCALAAVAGAHAAGPQAAAPSLARPNIVVLLLLLGLPAALWLRAARRHPAA